MCSISERDRTILCGLRKEGMIDELPKDYIKQYGKVVMIMCSDPLRHPDAFQHVRELLPHESGQPVIFSLTYLGGGLVLAPDSPVLPQGSTLDRDWIQAIRMANEVFGIRVVLGHNHVPCAMAYGKKLDAFRVCEMGLSAKRRVESEVPGVEYLPLVHTAHFREERMLTYRIPHERWNRKYQEELSVA